MCDEHESIDQIANSFKHDMINLLHNIQFSTSMFEEFNEMPANQEKMIDYGSFIRNEVSKGVNLINNTLKKLDKTKFNQKPDLN